MKNFDLTTKATMDISEFFVKMDFYFRKKGLQPQQQFNKNQYDIESQQKIFNDNINPIIFSSNANTDLQSVKIKFFIQAFDNFKASVYDMSIKSDIGDYNHFRLYREQKDFCQEFSEIIDNWTKNYTPYIEQNLLQKIPASAPNKVSKL